MKAYKLACSLDEKLHRLLEGTGDARALASEAHAEVHELCAALSPDAAIRSATTD